MRQSARNMQADACAGALLQKAAFVCWQVHLQERREAVWSPDMHMWMQMVQSLCDAVLHRDAWVHWHQLYQSRLMQQCFAVCLVERCFKRWKDKVQDMVTIKERADQLVVVREGRIVVQCWDSWVRAAEVRSADRDVARRVGACIVGDFVAFW